MSAWHAALAGGPLAFTGHSFTIHVMLHVAIDYILSGPAHIGKLHKPGVNRKVGNSKEFDYTYLCIKSTI